MEALRLDPDNFVDLKELLFENDVLVRFTKKNGDDREMVCTLRKQVIEQYEFKGETYKIKLGPLYVVWDLEKDAWRTFTEGSMYEYHPL